MRPDNDLDALIDETARSLTDAAPPATLRASVRGRIEGRAVKARPTAIEVGRPFTPRLRSGQAGRLAWAAAAIVVLAAAIVVLNREPRSVETPVATVTPAPAVVPPAPPSRTPEPVVPETVRVARPARAAAIVAEATADTPVAPLVIDAMTLETVAPMPLELEEMDAPMPLRAEWVEIVPLNIQ